MPETTVSAADIRRIVKHWMGRPHRQPQTPTQPYACVPCRILSELIDLIDDAPDPPVSVAHQQEEPVTSRAMKDAQR